MLQIVVNGTYYIEKSIFWRSKINWRFKKDCIYFYDYDKYVEFMLNCLSYSELQKLRLNIYNYFHKKITFTYFKEDDLNWGFLEWYNLKSDIIDIDNDLLARLLPSAKLRKKFFDYSDIKEKYNISWLLVNHVNLHVV